MSERVLYYKEIQITWKGTYVYFIIHRYKASVRNSKKYREDLTLKYKKENNISYKKLISIQNCWLTRFHNNTLSKILGSLQLKNLLQGLQCLYFDTPLSFINFRQTKTIFKSSVYSHNYWDTQYSIVLFKEYYII